MHTQGTSRRTLTISQTSSQLYVDIKVTGKVYQAITHNTKRVSLQLHNTSPGIIDSPLLPSMFNAKSCIINFIVTGQHQHALGKLEYRQFTKETKSTHKLLEMCTSMKTFQFYSFQLCILSDIPISNHKSPKPNRHTFELNPNRIYQWRHGTGFQPSN